MSIGFSLIPDNSVNREVVAWCCHCVVKTCRMPVDKVCRRDFIASCSNLVVTCSVKPYLCFVVEYLVFLVRSDPSKAVFNTEPYYYHIVLFPGKSLRDIIFSRRILIFNSSYLDAVNKNFIPVNQSSKEKSCTLAGKLLWKIKASSEPHGSAHP